MIASIRSFALITPTEFISPLGVQKHPGEHFADIPRESVYSELYRPFGKMGTTEKLIFSATALALTGITVPESTGIVCAVPRGSLETDIAYMNSVREEFPSPALFAATLPSALLAELAIPFSLKGPNRIIAGSDQSAVLLNALFMLQKNSPTVIAGFVNPDPTCGCVAVLILDKEPAPFTLSFTTEKTESNISIELFSSLVARIIGTNNISTLPTANGTFYLKENSHGKSD